MDESNDKFIIYLATDMAKDVYYVVKAKFYGNMTHDKGFYYTVSLILCSDILFLINIL